MQVPRRGDSHDLSAATTCPSGISLASERRDTSDCSNAEPPRIGVLQPRHPDPAGRRIDFLVGGAFAFVRYTGIGRDTKDLDLFIRRADWDEVTACWPKKASDGLTFPHWLGKAFGGREREFFVDLIFSGGNGVAEVDDEWFAYALRDESLGFPVRLMPVEEMIWSKAFLMERERFDGADVLHLIRARQHDINWPRLLRASASTGGCCSRTWCCFPSLPQRAGPAEVIDELLDRARDRAEADEGIRLCRGPLLSSAQYLVDVERWNYVDARQVPLGTMTPEEIDDLDQRDRDEKVARRPEDSRVNSSAGSGRTTGPPRIGPGNDKSCCGPRRLG